MANQPAKGSAKVPETRQGFEADDLRSLASFEDALRLLKDNGVTITDATQAIGDGFTMLEDKAKLIDVQCMILAWLFTPGDYGSDFVVARLMTETGDKYIVTDGSEGMCRQLREFTARTGATEGMLLPRGLRKSEFGVNKDGQAVKINDPEAEKVGITYYLNV